MNPELCEEHEHIHSPLAESQTSHGDSTEVFVVSMAAHPQQPPAPLSPQKATTTIRPSSATMEDYNANTIQQSRRSEKYVEKSSSRTIEALISPRKQPGTRSLRTNNRPPRSQRPRSSSKRTHRSSSRQRSRSADRRDSKSDKSRRPDRPSESSRSSSRRSSKSTSNSQRRKSRSRSNSPRREDSTTRSGSSRSHSRSRRQSSRESSSRRSSSSKRDHGERDRRDRSEGDTYRWSRTRSSRDNEHHSTTKHHDRERRYNTGRDKYRDREDYDRQKRSSERRRDESRNKSRRDRSRSKSASRSRFRSSRSRRTSVRSRSRSISSSPSRSQRSHSKYSSPSTTRLPISSGKENRPSRSASKVDREEFVTPTKPPRIFHIRSAPGRGSVARPELRGLPPMPPVFQPERNSKSRHKRRFEAARLVQTSFRSYRARKTVEKMSRERKRALLEEYESHQKRMKEAELERLEQQIKQIEAQKEEDIEMMKKSFEDAKLALQKRGQNKLEKFIQKQLEESQANESEKTAMDALEELEVAELQDEKDKLEKEQGELSRKISLEELEKEKLQKANNDIAQLFQSLNKFAMTKTEAKRKLVSALHKLSKVYHPKIARDIEKGKLACRSEVKMKAFHRSQMYNFAQRLESRAEYDLYEECCNMIKECESDLGNETLDFNVSSSNFGLTLEKDGAGSNCIEDAFDTTKDLTLSIPWVKEIAWGTSMNFGESSKSFENSMAWNSSSWAFDDHWADDNWGQLDKKLQLTDIDCQSHNSWTTEHESLMSWMG